MHSFDPAVGPGVVWLGWPVRACVYRADHVESHGPGADDVLVSLLVDELDAVVGEERVGFVRLGYGQELDELPGGAPLSDFDEFGNGELGSSVHADEQIALSLGRQRLGDVDVKEAGRIVL